MNDQHPPVDQPEDDEHAEGCGYVHEDPDDEETAELRPLFPQGAETDPAEVAETVGALEYLAALDA